MALAAAYKFNTWESSISGRLEKLFHNPMKMGMAGIILKVASKIYKCSRVVKCKSC
jgi:hypothetical protein